MAVLKLRATGRKATGTEFGSSFAGQIARSVAKHAQKHPDEQNPMEIDLNGKQLSNKGLREVLEVVISTLADHSNFQLEELHLSKNGLTTGILPVLSKVIHNSSFDLRALDLSGNAICVLNDEHARDWEQFLDAFRKCRVMCRLDLSGNDFSKSISMEILCRVYSSHRPIDPNELEGTVPVDNDMVSSREVHGSKLIEKTNSLTLQQPDDSFVDMSASEDSLSNATVLKRREGLRSIPYIVLRNVGMDDAGVLWLSKIVEQHYWPQYLLTTLKEGSHAAKLVKEDQSTGAFGIIYVDNPNITAVGVKSLELAEQARVELAGISEMSGHDQDEFQDAVDFATQSRKGQMDHFRKKLERTTIEAVGVSGVQLWAAALHLMNLTRAIVPSTASQRRDPEVIASMSVVASDEQRMDAPVDIPQSVVSHSSKQPASSQISGSDFPTLPAFPHKILRIITAPDNSVTVVDSTPTKPSREKGLAPRSSPLKNEKSPVVSRTLSNPATNISLIAQGLGNLGEVSIPTYTPPINQMVKKSEDWPMGLHGHLWIRALTQIGRDGGVLSKRQVESVVRYAGEKDSLRVEMEGMGRARSVQIWGGLERMGCLEYEMEM